MEMAAVLPGAGNRVGACADISASARSIDRRRRSVPAFEPPPVDECYRVVTTLTSVGPVYEQDNCIEKI
jgi:hypothetical protein